MLVITHKLIIEKKNEISSSIELLSAITLRAGDIVTADAMNTQKKLVAFLGAIGISVGSQASVMLDLGLILRGFSPSSVGSEASHGHSGLVRCQVTVEYRRAVHRPRICREST